MRFPAGARRCFPVAAEGQLESLLAAGDLRALALEIPVRDVLADRWSPEPVAQEVDRALERGDLAVVYTTRDLVSGEDNLAIGQKVSDGLVAALQQVQARPRFVIAKGAITSHDLAQPDRRRPFASGAKLRIALDKRAHDIAVESARCRALSSGVGAAKRMRARPPRDRRRCGLLDDRLGATRSQLGMTGTTVNLTMGSLDDSRLSDRGRSSVLA